MPLKESYLSYLFNSSFLQNINLGFKRSFNITQNVTSVLLTYLHFCDLQLLSFKFKISQAEHRILKCKFKTALSLKNPPLQKQPLPFVTP